MGSGLGDALFMPTCIFNKRNPPSKKKCPPQKRQIEVGSWRFGLGLALGWVGLAAKGGGDLLCVPIIPS